jgi:DNA-binding winged helix-turn-helix (wHTH) protein
MVIERSEPNLSHLHGEAPPARATNLEWRMGSLVLDPVARILIHDGTPLPLGERAVSILLMLVERSGQLVSKEDLIAFAWQGLAVEDSNLTVQVAALRRALALVSGGRSLIETLPRRGYRFVGTAVRSGDNDPPTPDEPRAARSSYEMAKLPSSKLVDDQKDLPTVSALTDSRAHHMVGRAAPLDMLDRMAQRMLSGQRQIAFVTGEAGIGKTAFIQMAVDRLSQQDVDLLCGRCTERFGTDEAFLPLIDALVTRCRSTNGAELQTAIRTHAPTWMLQ